jgi:hypothetical protein
MCPSGDPTTQPYINKSTTQSFNDDVSDLQNIDRPGNIIVDRNLSTIFYAEVCYWSTKHNVSRRRHSLSQLHINKSTAQSHCDNASCPQDVDYADNVIVDRHSSAALYVEVCCRHQNTTCLWWCLSSVKLFTIFPGSPVGSPEPQRPRSGSPESQATTELREPRTPQNFLKIT